MSGIGTAAADWRALARPLLPEAVRFSDDGKGDPLAALHELGGPRVLLVHGRHSYQASGAVAWLAPALAGRDVQAFDAVVPNPTAESVAACAAAIVAHRPSLLVAVGGGSALDTAKAARHVWAVRGDAEARTVLRDGGQPDAARLHSLPFVAIPTTAGTGSEVTHFAAVYVDGVKQSLADPSMLPTLALLEPTLTASLPRATRVASGLDALAQAIESTWSVGSDATSRQRGLAALRLGWDALPDAVAGDADAQARMLLAAALAGLSIDHAKTTACHALSYTMTAEWGVDHGVAVALTLAPMLRHNLAVTADDCTDPRGVAHVRAVLGEILAVVGSADEWEARLAAFGISTALADHGIAGEAAIERIVRSVNLQRLRNNPRALGDDDLRAVLSDRAC